MSALAMQVSEAVVAHAGDTDEASLNLYGVGGNNLVPTVQVDETVFVVGQDEATSVQ